MADIEIDPRAMEAVRKCREAISALGNSPRVFDIDLVTAAAFQAFAAEMVRDALSTRGLLECDECDNAASHIHKRCLQHACVPDAGTKGGA